MKVNVPHNVEVKQTFEELKRYTFFLAYSSYYHKTEAFFKLNESFDTANALRLSDGHEVYFSRQWEIIKTFNEITLA